MTAPIIHAIGLLATSALLQACGGGGGGGSSQTPTPTPTPTPPPANVAPTANAGADQSVEAGASVTLDGSQSSDSDGSIASYEWEQTDGPTVDLSGADQAQASFAAPSASIDVELTFRLSVADDDGASTFDTVTISVDAVVAATEVNLSGLVLPSASQSLDGDTNDPFNPLQDNTDPSNPQPLNNPTTLGGYVNEPGSGAEGRSQVGGDREDFFLVSMLAGQTINLLVAEFQDADADLYLYSEAGDLIDFSIETGQREAIDVQEDGTYLVNVSIFSGATNYTLAIGSALAPTSNAYRDVIPDQVIVTYDNEQRAAELQERFRSDLRMRQLSGGPERERLMTMDSLAQNAPLMARRFGKQSHRYDRFVDRDKAAIWETLISIKNMARLPGVRTAEPNYRVYPTATVNDEAFSFQWHYPLINVPGAWDTTVGESSVIVAVIDTGVLAGHPDLAGQLVDGFDFIRDPGEAADGDGIDPNPEETIGTTDPAAINFHGTHVTGTVAAAGNNSIGVSGVAYGARVMPLRALNASGGTTYDVNQAVRFAAGLENDSGTLPPQPADVINLSLGGAGFITASQNLYNEVRARGIIVVAAAGNESTTVPSYPASYANVISVSAVDAQQRITGYSNTGSAVDIAAPGGDGRVDFNGDGYPDGVLSTGASDGEFAYTFLSGTSMASPHVAGVMALMKSVNPNLDADDVDRLLESGALTDDFGAAGRDNQYGHGIVNARRAVDAALTDGGGSTTSEPRLTSSTSALNFGTVRTELELTLSNAGSGDLENVSLSSNQPWLSTTPLSVDAAGLGRYTVQVSRDGLEPGIYEGTLAASSNINSIEIRILLSVADATESELGQIYLLLFDPAADEVVAQTVGELTALGYSFTMPTVPSGSYQFFAGTDLDNDLLICDPGEACGAYITIDQPLTLEVTSDRDDINFPIEYLIAIPGAAAASSNGTIEASPELRRQPDKP
ncbi:MAG: S8 family serine peptidase [Pseudomonadota bacterium]